MQKVVTFFRKRSKVIYIYDFSFDGVSSSTDDGTGGGGCDGNAVGILGGNDGAL